MITGGDLRQSRLDVGYKTFTISPWVVGTSHCSGFIKKPDYHHASAPQDYT